MTPRRRRRRKVVRTPADQILDGADTSLLDVIDNVLNRGVVLNGEVALGIAGVDLVYLRLSVLLAAADRIFVRDSRRRA
jgi:gas vesicle protein GvpA/GvpJ/GvpM family